MFVKAKAYRDSCLFGTRFRYFKSWARTKIQFNLLTEEEFNKCCIRINQCAYVFENWEAIATNLADPRITAIDARRLSFNQFYRAKNMDWCLSYNEVLRQKASSVEDPSYTEEKFNEIFNFIRDSNILHDIEYKPRLAAALGERLKMRIINHCRRINPY